MHHSVNGKELDATFQRFTSKKILTEKIEIAWPGSALYFHVFNQITAAIFEFTLNLLIHINIRTKYSEFIFSSRLLFSRRLDTWNKDFQVPAVRKNKQLQVATKLRAKSTHSLDICFMKTIIYCL